MTTRTYYPEDVAQICQMLADACDRRLALGWLVLPSISKANCCCPLGAAMDDSRPPGSHHLQSEDPYFERPIAEDAHVLGLEINAALGFIYGFENGEPNEGKYSRTNDGFARDRRGTINYLLFRDIGIRFNQWYTAASMENVLEYYRL